MLRAHLYEVSITKFLIQIHSRLGKGLSDIFRILSVVGAYEFSGGGHRFCHDNFVRPKVAICQISFISVY